MSLNRLQQNIRAAISLKDFKGRDECYVREEFLVPLFKAVGYDAFGSDIIARGVYLRSDPQNIASKKRAHVFPDFVLYKNKVPLWVVDAKSPKMKVNSQRNIEQVLEYSLRLKCQNAILSNAIETYAYKLQDDKLQDVLFINIDELRRDKFESLINLLKPECAVKNMYSFDEALDLYRTDDYIDRSYLMKILQLYSYEDIQSFLNDFGNKESYRSTHFRDRALPAILMSKHASKDKNLLNRISEFSLADRNSIVRENYFTCLTSGDSDISPDYHGEIVYSHKHTTYLERVLYMTFLSTTQRGRNMLSSYNDLDSFLKQYSDLLLSNNPASFPIALLMKKPLNLSYLQYTRYLDTLPGLFEKIDKCPDSHIETFKVLNDCLAFAKSNNKNVYDRIVSMSSKRQRCILDYYSSKREL